MRKAAFVTCFLAGLAGPVAAQDDSLPPLPKAFAVHVVWSEMAIFLDGLCPQIELDLPNWREADQLATEQLNAEGFTPITWSFESAGIPDEVTNLVQTEFYQAYGVQRADFEATCAAAVLVDEADNTALAAMIAVQ